MSGCSPGINPRAQRSRSRSCRDLACASRSTPSRRSHRPLQNDGLSGDGKGKREDGKEPQFWLRCRKHDTFPFSLFPLPFPVIPIIEEDALRAVMTPDRAVAAMREAFRADGEGRTVVPPVINLDVPGARGE